MSLIRQLWLAVLIGTITAFAGSFVVSMFTARQYLEQQLTIKNVDNAASLALSMTQLAKDPVTIELQVAALADSGQYRLIRITDPQGKTLIENASPQEANDVPAWFVSLFPIASQMGRAQISDGWKQFGTIQLVSHNDFAYQELWNGGLRLLAWFAIGGMLMGLLGMGFMRSIRRPLLAVVNQAQAISQRRFITIAEPRTPELRSMARAMNTMVERLNHMFAEEAARLDAVRREATQDSLTGLANRSHFMARLDSALSSEDAARSGTLLMLRLADLTGINRHAGREAADQVLMRTAQALSEACSTIPGAVAARLNGADFALLLPSVDDAEPIAHLLLEALHNMAAAGLLEADRQGHVAFGLYHHGDAIGNLLARIDAALATAETQGGQGWARAEETARQGVASNADWRKLLEGAVETQRLRLIEFPVAGNNGQILHLECPLRLQASENGEWLAAGSFMPMASRLAMTTELDLAATRLAIDRIAAGLPAVAVNLSGESVFEPHFRERLLALLNSHKEHATHLWLEVSEIGAFQHFFAFREFCSALRPLGVRLGIEHFGRQFSEIGRLHDIGLDYLKVDSSFIRGIDQNAGNQAFLKGLCSIAHNIGLTVIAEGVQTAAELALLPDLGFDGATGPAVSAN
mgnify:CR=1 FL=1